MCNLIMLIDKANDFFYDPEKINNPKEAEIDYEAIERYVECVRIDTVSDFFCRRHYLTWRRSI